MALPCFGSGPCEKMAKLPPLNMRDLREHKYKKTIYNYNDIKEFLSQILSQLESLKINFPL
jgi:hypothetical protein